MKTAIILILLFLASPASAAELTAPPVPESGKEWMPSETLSFSDAMAEMFEMALQNLLPNLKEATAITTAVICAALLTSFLQKTSGSIPITANFAGSTAIAVLLLRNSNTLLHLGANTVSEITSYGKLFLPVMTSALAAQGRISTSAALYTGSVFFISLLNNLISSLLLPCIYLFLALSVVACSTEEESLKKLRNITKNGISWCLKTLLTVFTSYISITSIISGTADTIKIKATKLTLSSVIPVVGGILSDASEAVLVSTAMMKSTAGVYGILAVFAIFIGPVLRIGSHYLVMKFTAAVCTFFCSKNISDMIDDFSAAMGLLLAMTGSAGLMMLISTVCFMKGIG